MVNEIIDLYNSGMKMRDVAKQLNISHHKVSKVLKECGVKIRIRNDYGNPAQAPDFAERVISKRRSYAGENNPNYKDGFDGDKAYRKICFKYHPKKCCICGFDHIVEVHHMDCNKNNNNPDNLIPLCPNHHRMFHSRYRQLVSPLIEEYINNNRV